MNDIYLGICWKPSPKDQPKEFPGVATPADNLMLWIVERIKEDAPHLDRLDTFTAAEAVADGWWQNTRHTAPDWAFPSDVPEIEKAITAELLEWQEVEA